MNYSLSMLKGQKHKARTNKGERADLFEKLEALSLSECKEMYEWVKAHKSEFTLTEIELYQAAATRGGLRRLRILDKKRERARMAGVSLSKLKAGAFEDDGDAEILKKGLGYATPAPRTKKQSSKANKGISARTRSTGQTTNKKAVERTPRARLKTR